MLDAKRTKIRKQIRSQQLNRLFSIHRKSFLQGKNAFLKDLFNQVCRNQHEPLHYDLVNRLLNCLKIHDQQENIYVIVANYIFDHNSAETFFFHQIVDNPKYLENHSWCLMVFAHIALGQISQGNEEHREIGKAKLVQIMLSFTENGRNVQQALRRNARSGKQQKIWLYFLDTLMQFLNAPTYIKLPGQSITLFCEMLSEFQDQSPKQQQLMQVWKCIYTLSKSWDHLQQLLLDRLFILSISNYILLCIRILPQIREECIDLLKVVQIKSNHLFMMVFFKIELLDEIVYALDSLPALRPAIVQLISQIYPQTDLQQLVMMLELRVHVHLVDCMGWAIQKLNSSCLQDCLASIYALLNRLNQQNETRIINRIQSEIQDKQFEQMLSTLAENDQPESISHLVNLLIDDFYSEEVA